MRYSDELIEDIRMKNDIVDVISGYVKLTRKGSSYFGLCPFHNEKSPSFSVSPGKQMYYCFGCGAGGNVFTFLMQYENYTFQESLKVLADRAGIELPEQDYSREEKEKQDLKSRLLEINKKAASFYYYQLRTDAGRQGMAYLKNRGLSDETMKKFGLGYSDKYGSLLYKYLKQQNYSDELLRQTGLFNYDEKRGMQDKFWNRVIFPIMDANSRVVGFGGRVMGDAKPKYLNSPETPVFEKSRNLYGLHIARSARKKNLIICEGYMDVISMHQAGFSNAVASLGTALTSSHCSLLKRYTDQVLVIYDMDEAGVKAALRAIPMLRASGLETRVVNLRPHKDPDEFIKAEGREAFEERLQQAENSFLYEIRMMQRDYDTNDPQGRTAFQNAVAAKIAQLDDEFERNNLIEEIARLYNIDKGALSRKVGNIGLSNAGISRPPEPRMTHRENKEKESAAEKSQKLMLTWLTSKPDLVRRLSEYLSPEDFVTPLYHQIAEMVYLQYQETGTVNPAKLLNQFSDSDDQQRIAGILNTTIPLETGEQHQALVDVLLNLKEQSLEYRSQHSDPADMTALMKYMKEKKLLGHLRVTGIDF